MVHDEDLTDKQPVAPVDLTASLSAPVLGLFGNDDPRESARELATRIVEALDAADRLDGEVSQPDG